ALLLGALVGFMVPRLFIWKSATPPPAAPFVLSDWEYPEAKSHTKLEGESSKVYAYSSPDALEKVWGHYAKLSGADKEFKPGASSAKTDFAFSLSAGRGTSTTGGVLYYTGDPSRPSVRSATLVARRPGYTVTVFLSRSKDEDQTHISMVVEEKPSQP